LQTGPGIVNMTITSPVGNGVYIHNVTPVEPLKQRLVQQIYFSRFVPPFIPKLFLLAEALMVWLLQRGWGYVTSEHLVLHSSVFISL
jgi:hypothetical protein